MDIFVDRPSSTSEKKEEKRQPSRPGKRRERRKGGRDRRRSVNEGLVVSLSVREERRSFRERRRDRFPEETEFHLPKKGIEKKRGPKFSIIA